MSLPDMIEWAKEHPNRAAVRIAELERENAELRAWKESALAVERELNAQTLAKLLGARLGESCHKAIAQKVPQLVAENSTLRLTLAEILRQFDFIKSKAQVALDRKEAKP